MTKSPVRLLPYLLPLVALVVAPRPSLAQAPVDEPLVTDRPDFTESAASVAPARVQLEAGATWESADDVETLTLGEALVRIGVVHRVELRIGVPSWIDAGDVEGLDAGFLGAKVELPAGAGWDFALLGGTSVPIGDEDVAPDAWEPELVLAASRDLREGTGLGLNLGWARPDEGDDELRGSAAVGVDLGEGWGAFAEAFGFATADDAGPAFLDAGVTRLFGPDFQLDARVGAGLFQASGDVFVGIGFSRRW